jgi:arylsulfatase A-like enzyme
MKCILLMFDSLNRHMLEPYGCEWVRTPSFRRLSERTVTFENSYVGSMPCIPARRELHTGRYNFLHRSWGPVEPFDDSMPEMLARNGVYTHLVTDHWHYFQEGGATYHTRFKSWEFLRGLEGDPWKGEVKEPEKPELSPGQFNVPGLSKTRQDWVNRKYIRDADELPQAQTLARGMEFMRTNKDADNWFLQIECFDPHEPFTPLERHLDLYPHRYEGKFFDWPKYAKVHETEEEVEHLRCLYAARVSQCDEYLGKFLDLMDEQDMWKDTMLIVCTDHGYLLGEHGWWAKNKMPWYNELANTPLFIWDPRGGRRGERSDAMVQLIDFAPTILALFGVSATKDMLGKDLAGTLARDDQVRDSLIFGHFGGHVNVFDGRYVYMRGFAGTANRPLYEYTLMPTKLAHTFDVAELQSIELREPFSFTKGCRVMKIAGFPQHVPRDVPYECETLLFDVQNDRAQQAPLADPVVERRMIGLLVRHMKENDAPAEQYVRLGLDPVKDAGDNA